MIKWLKILASFPTYIILTQNHKENSMNSSKPEFRVTIPFDETLMENVAVFKMVFGDLSKADQVKKAFSIAVQSIVDEELKTLAITQAQNQSPEDDELIAMQFDESSPQKKGLRGWRNGMFGVWTNNLQG